MRRQTGGSRRRQRRYCPTAAEHTPPPTLPPTPRLLNIPHRLPLALPPTPRRLLRGRIYWGAGARVLRVHILPSGSCGRSETSRKKKNDETQQDMPVARCFQSTHGVDFPSSRFWVCQGFLYVFLIACAHTQSRQ
jgi:hypothetical protein